MRECLLKNSQNGVIIIFERNMSERIKNKLDSILTEEQKREIIEKIKTTDKNELERMMKASKISSMSENEILDILSKIKRL